MTFNEADFLLEIAQIQAECIGWSRRLMDGCTSADAVRNDIIVATGARFTSKRWFKELATKADLNEEELLSLAKNHFTPR